MLICFLQGGGAALPSSRCRLEGRYKSEAYQPRSVDDVNPVSLNICYTTIIPRALIDKVMQDV